MSENKLNLILHAGGRSVELDALEHVLTPVATQTWQPLPHLELFQTVKETIERSGLRVTQAVHGLAKEGLRYFGMMQLASEDGDGEYGFVAGLRNSHDMSFPAGLAMGAGVFICDNLAFSSEITLGRKHTVHIRRDLPRLVTSAVGKLSDYRHRQNIRYERYHATKLMDSLAHDLIIQAVDAQSLPVTKIPEVLKEWREPSHAEFTADGMSAWRLFNAFTEAMKGLDPALLSRRTVALHGLFDTACGVLKEVPATVVA
jgi:Domain of unknown function (DUF932)